MTRITKICILLPLCTITSFLSVCFPHAYTSLKPWLDVFQAVALGSFFLLLCELISKDSDTETDIFFTAFEVPQNKGKSHLTGLKWFRVFPYTALTPASLCQNQWIPIFQYPVIAFGVAIATDVTQAVEIYCLGSNEPYFAHLWLAIISIISVAFAVMSVLNFYRGLTGFSQAWIIFAILRTTDTLTPTTKLSYADVTIGIPYLIVCL
ncbi:hypothetical protein N7533_013442 [Penicillium manginii]|uniref:uncharacterized protein n=1 Tax=Penicillium manginii TaxID=203109 RepID=UPI0025482CFE|nr:uncharacterized protein N7533_013442 [Penicillium manginii]KAJ5732995.1 hypothetical protein N7533_013442 [Penicillium manginii]